MAASAVLVVAFLVAATPYAQPSATLQRRVFDASGAFLPGAGATVHNA
jgi:hypothetical protein